MKKINFLIALLIISACHKEENPNAIPTYFQIDAITLDENNTTANITDAWVYIDEQKQGVYELPVTFPVLEKDYHTLKIRAGIKSNGIASSRLEYLFYSSFIDTLLFAPNQTIIVNPIVSYLESAEFWLEDFETGLSLDIDSVSFSIDDVNGIDNKYGKIILQDSMLLSEITTFILPDLPQDGNPVFLELDYKCNTEFLVGMYVSFPQSVIQKDLLWINPKDEWNKIYINLTQTIIEGINATSFKVFIGMKRDLSLEKNEVHLDNLKLVY